MKVRDRIFEQYESYDFNLPLDDSIKLFVKEGEEISYGDKLFSRGESSINESVYLPKELGCSVRDVRECINVLSGEFVEKGDILAEKASPNGLSTKRIEARHNGIVSDKRIKDGYIDILGEKEEIVVKSNFSGKVLSADSVRGFNIRSQASVLDLRAISKDFYDSKDNDRIISGEFVVLGDGTSVYTVNDLEDNYRGKIIFAGRYVYEDVIKKLFELGASCVISYSMDYETFRSINLPITVIGGFGNMSFPDEIRKKLAELSGSFVVADGEERQLFFIKKLEKYTTSKFKDNFVDIYIGEKVISYEPQTYGRVGEVISFDEESNYLTIEFKRGVNGVVSVDAVDFLGL